jgi:hypothetical protein
MAYDRTTDEYHLTLTGWIHGTSKVFGRGEDEQKPDTTIETWQRFSEQASGWSSKETVCWSLLWKDDYLSSEERAKIRNQFPKPYHDFKEE